MNDNNQPTPTILVVDDNVDIQAVLTISLEQHGYRVLTAGSAGSALAILEKDTPGLAIIDFGLPGTNGIDLGEKLRQLPTGLNTKLVLLSGDHDAELADRATKIGFEAYLVKPVPMQQLLTTMRELGLPAPT